ncbi:MAG: T9SS type A sorting domain-containing protein [Chitinophagales bacterium]|nr:T9SS type A sorting domain-containing protein [Chitinophagales bacterium]MBP8754353.1 T9SS type A sorting domain-containing protein [Chitinophagales bacterium]MBP9548636.1 T9SS type A sorting domain-containing protein [Chitinophagales bacterium]
MQSQYLKTFFFSILFSISTICFSQQYGLIDQNRIRTYGIDSTDYFFIKVDSIKIQGTDSIFYFNRYIDTSFSAECQRVNIDTQIIGPKMVKLNDAEETNVFFNRNGDSIFLKLNQPVGSFWRLYNYPDGKHIRATVAPKLYFTVLPETFDSVYRLLLNVYDDVFILQPDSIMNGAKMEVSKNYGLVEFKNFYSFPNDTNATFLKGINNPENNIVDVNSKHAFNFQLGNEFHYITEELIGDIESIYSLKKEKFFVLDKTQYADSVKYVMYHAAWEATSSGFEAPDTIRTIDTVTITYRYADYAFLDSLEMTLLQANNFGYSDFFKSDTIYWGRAYKEVFDWFDYDASENCLSNSDNIYLPEQRYGDGIGIMHYKDSTDVANYIIKDQVWFQKGLEVWGDPIDFEELGVVDVKDIIAYGQIQLYPNPANDNILFTLPEIDNTIEITITDMQGKNVLSQTMQATSVMQLNISEFIQGFYLIHISGEKISYNGKFIKN